MVSFPFAAGARAPGGVGVLVAVRSILSPFLCLASSCASLRDGRAVERARVGVEAPLFVAVSFFSRFTMLADLRESSPSMAAGCARLGELGTVEARPAGLER